MMIERLIDVAVHKRGIVLGAVAVLLSIGVWAFATIPFEAFPDLTANSVSIITEAPGLAPQEVEQLVTFPIERALLGLPDAEVVRSTTKFGLSITQVVFDDGVDSWFARQVVSQRLGDVAALLPPDVTPQLGPPSTAMGEVFQYVLTASTPEWDPTSLKTLQDYTIAPQLRTVPGVAEVNSWGGLTERIEIVADPARLATAGLTLGDIERAVARENLNFGGASIESRQERFVVRGLGRFTRPEQIADIPVTVAGQTPVRLGDVAEVVRGALPREGAVSADGRGEVVSGMVIMRKGENAQRVMAGIAERIRAVEATLPAGVALVPFYDQTELVKRTTHTVEKNLLMGGALVVAVLWLFLRNTAAALIVAVVIPLSMLWAFIAMRIFGFSANLMSLGALDFGLLVDGSIVLVENVMRRAHGHADKEGAPARIHAAAVEVGRPIVFGIAIIIAVYLPLFALEGTERKMFVPMAFTVMAALMGSLLLALTLVPAAARTFLATAVEPDWPAFERLRERYQRLIAGTLGRAPIIISTGVVATVLAVFAMSRLGSEFMPRLDEGSVLVQARRLPATALSEGVRFSGLIERALVALPEVRTVVSKLGRPDLATEAMGSYESDTYVILTEKESWRKGGKAAIVQAMDSVLRDIPGLSVAFTQPIQMRLDEAESGITTDVGVQLFGSDADTLAMLGGKIERLLAGVPGAADVKTIAASRMKQVTVTLDRARMAPLGLSADDVAIEVERALGAKQAGALIDGARRIPIAVRLAEASRIDPERLAELPIARGRGAVVPLGAVAEIKVVEAPEAFAHEGGQRLVVVGANIRGRDVGSFVADAEAKLASTIQLPSGYRTEWGGQYRHQQSALARLRVLVPVAILAIFGLLYMAFGTWRHAALIMSNVPFALVGGVASLWLMGLNLSLSASVGFIALFGIAVLNGVVMVTSINDLLREGKTLADALVIGAGSRLRPVLMTAFVAGLGFVPMAVSTSAGAELQRPLATVVIGGLLTSTLLTLVVLPTLYGAVERWVMKHPGVVIED
ncbi:MAG: efflux RND transporter permease subunit [Gemmatimonadetes bacterium]|nr:efflux RND transporter permease subunit [Gemmatimonadota bacterium]